MNRRGIALSLFLLWPLCAFAADDPLNGIGQLIFSGRPKEAREMLLRARDSFATSGDASREAATWLLLGMTDASANDPANSRAELQQAATRYLAVNDVFGAWLSYFALASLETAEGQTAAAIAAHERLQTALHEVESSTAHFSIDSIKTVAPVFGASVESLGPLAANPDLMKPILLRFMSIMASDAYAATLIEAGDFTKAEEQLNRASEGGLLFGGMFDVTIEAHRGTLRQRQWRLDEARVSYLKALKAAKTMGSIAAPSIIGHADPMLEINLMNDLAELEMLGGELDKALDWNDRALKAARGSANLRREAALLENRAELLQKGGRIDAALITLDEALQSAVKNADVHRQASIYSTLGSLHMFQGNYGTAAKHLEKSVELYQTLHEPYLEAPVWLLIAEVYVLLDSKDNARAALETARTLAATSKFTLASTLVDALSKAKVVEGRTRLAFYDESLLAWLNMPEAKGLMFSDDAKALLAESMRLIADRNAVSNPDIPIPAGQPMLAAIAVAFRGKAAFERAQYETARSYFKKALAMNPNRDHKAGLLALIGVSYWKEQNAEDAIRYFRQSADALDASAADVKVEEMLSSFLGGDRRWYYDLLIDMLISEGHTVDAFAQAERARARAFLQLVGNHRLNPERGADPQLISQAENLRADIAEREKSALIAKPEDAVRLATDLEGARQHYRTVMIRVKATSYEYADVTNVAPLQVDSVQNDLPADSTLISYYVSLHAVHAWVVDRMAVHYALLPLDATGMKRLVCWADTFGATETRGAELPTPCGDKAATADEAYKALIEPIRKYMTQKKLILVPHGVLHYIPFAALHDQESNHYLVEDYTLTYAPSASVLRFLHAKESPIDGTTLVLGDPDSPLPLRKLPGAAKEAVYVAAKLGGTPRIGADAREAALYGLGGKVDLVHIAAHGLYDPANPLFSRIALAPSKTFDGGLTVHEILSSVDLRGVNLVVLSACRSAVGERSGGDEIVGLTRALLYAGTPGVISTLWNINDSASAGLMNAFYDRLTKGVSVAEALQQAQIEVLQTPAFSDPRYWAAFTLSGDPLGRWNPTATAQPVAAKP